MFSKACKCWVKSFLSLIAIQFIRDVVWAFRIAMKINPALFTINSKIIRNDLKKMHESITLLDLSNDSNNGINF